jgi:Fe(3+) dicitrate transport protein
VAEHFSDATNAVRTSTAVEGIIPSYQIIDLSLKYGYKIFQIEGSLNNLLNEYYFTRRAEAYPGPGIIPSDGRGIYITFQVKI